KFIIATAAGVGPDLVMFSQWTELAERGLLEPLDAFLEHSELREKFHPAVWMEKSLDGLIYSVPAVEGGPNMGLLFNRDLFIESGLPDFHPDEVLTWTEFGDQVRRLARYDEEGRLVRLGFYPPEAGAHGLVKTASMWDVDWYDWETGQAVLDRPELVE